MISETETQPKNGVSFSEGLAQVSHSHTHEFLQTFQFYLTFIGLHLTFPSAVDLFSSCQLSCEIMIDTP